MTVNGNQQMTKQAANTTPTFGAGIADFAEHHTHDLAAGAQLLVDLVFDLGDLLDARHELKFAGTVWAALRLRDDAAKLYEKVLAELEGDG